MIPKSRKFPLRSDRAILRRGKRSRGSLLEIYTRDSSFPQIAVIVGKNVDLKSTQRNLVKRRITAALVSQLDNLKVDVVARALPSSRGATYEQITTELRELFTKI